MAYPTYNKRLYKMIENNIILVIHWNITYVIKQIDKLLTAISRLLNPWATGFGDRGIVAGNAKCKTNCLKKRFILKWVDVDSYIILKPSPATGSWGESEYIIWCYIVKDRLFNVRSIP